MPALTTGTTVSGLSVLAQEPVGAQQVGSATLTADDAATAQPCQVTFVTPTATTTCTPKPHGKGKPDGRCP
jgi:hypothetical protein